MLLFLPALLTAQVPDSIVSGSKPPGIQPVDTLPLTYILSDHPEQSLPAADSMPGFDFRMYDPARRKTPDCGTLGNLGTPARPLWFETPYRRGFDVGVHAFDLYRLNANDLRYYENSRSFSEVFFSQGQNQDNVLFTAQMARTFSGGSTLAFEYHSYNNLGQFRFQQAKHNSLAVGLRIPLGSRYEAYLAFCQNVFRQQDNGGIVTDTVFGTGQFQGPVDAEVRLPGESAKTRSSDSKLQLTQHYKFAGQEAGKRVFRATHTIAWSKEFWKFYDDDMGADSTYFGSFFLTDQRGLRNHVRLKRLDNSLILTTFKQRKNGGTADVLAVGLLHSWFQLYQEPLDSSFSNLFLTGDLGFAPAKQFSLTARGELGMLKNFGEYHLHGSLLLDLGKAGQFRASVLSQRHPPSLLQYRSIVSFRELWSNDFKKPLETSLSAGYALPLIGFEASGRIHLLNNFLYFDQNALPAQTGAPLQIVQLLATENLKFGHFHFDNTIGIQQANRSDVLRLPTWFSKNSFYFSGKVFHKRMNLNAGVDFRMNSEFRPEGYYPLTGQFHLQDTITQKPYPWLDVFLDFKVRSFRFFFRYENIGALWMPGEVYYQTALYPQTFNTFRLGINWRFMDSNQPETSKKSGNPEDVPPVSIGPRGN